MVSFYDKAVRSFSVNKDPFLTVVTGFLKWALVILVLFIMAKNYELQIFNAFVIGATVFSFCSIFEAFFNANLKNGILLAMFKSDSQEQNKLFNIGVVGFLLSVVVVIFLAIISGGIVKIFHGEKLNSINFLVIAVAAIATLISSSLSFVDSLFISSGKLYQVRIIEIFYIILIFPFIMMGGVNTFSLLTVAILSFSPITFSRLTAVFIFYKNYQWEIKLNLYSFINYYQKRISSSAAFTMTNLVAYGISAIPIYQLSNSNYHNDLAVYGVCSKIFGAPILALTYLYPFFWKFLGENFYKNNYSAINKLTNIYIFGIILIYLSFFFCILLFKPFLQDKLQFKIDWLIIFIMTLYFISNSLIGFISVKLTSINAFKEQFFVYGLILFIYIWLSFFLLNLSLLSIYSSLFFSHVAGLALFLSFKSHIYKKNENK